MGLRRNLIALVGLGLAVTLPGCSRGSDAEADRPTTSTTAAQVPGSALLPIDREGWGEVETTYTGSGPRVVILGDSITVGSRPHLRAALPEVSLKIAALWGEGLSGGPVSLATGAGSMPEVAARYAPDEPDVVVLALGTNDAWRPALTLDAARAALEKIVAAFPRSCLVTATITEVARVEGYDGAEAAALNAMLRAAGDQVVPWAEVSGEDPDRYLYEDQVHPTEDGATRFAELVRAGVDACLDQPR